MSRRLISPSRTPSRLSHKDNPQGYTDLVCETMLPMLQEWWGTHAPRLALPFVDVFCETKAFDLNQSRVRS